MPASWPAGHLRALALTSIRPPCPYASRALRYISARTPPRVVVKGLQGVYTNETKQRRQYSTHRTGREGRPGEKVGCPHGGGRAESRPCGLCSVPPAFIKPINRTVRAIALVRSAAPPARTGSEQGPPPHTPHHSLRLHTCMASCHAPVQFLTPSLLTFSSSPLAFKI